MTLRPSLVVAAFLAAGVPAGAGERIAGPVAAEVVRVIDGDTIEVTARVWPGVAITVGARIRGIDTPELRGDCREEIILAAAASDRLAEAVVGGRVSLSNVEEDKYAGRVVADVATPDGTDLGRLMIASGLARPYDGRTRGKWCALASLGG